MKVICINDSYNSIQFGGILTVGKIYNVEIDSIDNAPTFRRVFKIKCDDNHSRALPDDILIPIQQWREQQLNKLGI